MHPQAQQGAASETEQQELELVPVWHTSLTGGGLTCYTTVQVPTASGVER